ncbi:hypothetical protein I4U23_001682 [Adineta vaga]|nr:hypothetical protein I4U23_001682 [Adineta vaga]
MSETIMDEVPSSNGLITTEGNVLVEESGVKHEDEETWLYGKPKLEENADSATASSIDEVTTQDIDTKEQVTVPLQTNPTAALLLGSQIDDDSDDDDDDGIQVTIGNIKSGAAIFPPARQNSRTTIPSGPVIPPKPQVTRGIDLDAQGMINGQSTYEHDLMNAYKDEEKPWKKPGADISDYFNYGFTEETWAQYCDRQRRLRADNNLARLNATHMPQMPPMMPGHPPMMHPMNPHPAMMMNKPPMNMPIMQRPFMNVRKPDGKIDVIGATDQTSRRPMFEAPNAFEHIPFMNGPPFPGGQQPNNQTVGDLVTPPPTSNGPPPSHGTPPGGNHPIPTLGAPRMAMIPPPGMQFRPQFGHPHAPGAPQFFPHGPGGAMHGERPPQPYFIPHHPQQPWDKPGGPPVHGFPPGHFPPQASMPGNTGNGRPTSSRSPTPEDHSSRSSTPEENRPSGNGSGIGGDNDKSSKDDRYKDRYRDDREHYSSSRRRPSPKDRSSSSYRSRHRSGDHEYERPRGDRKSSRDRDDKYERYSRKRHHRDDSGRHHRGGGGDDDPSRVHRFSSYTTKEFFITTKSTRT